MNPPCARCNKPVYPVEKIVCLDQSWHNGCFACEVCKIKLTMKTYKGFQKRPYCAAHYPQLKATTVVETPENLRLANQSKNQSNITYRAEYEQSKGQYTEVADTPEMAQMRANSQLSQAKYAQRPTDDDGGYSAPAQSYSAPAVPQQSLGEGGKRYRAQFAYTATDSDEVSFNEGDVIVDGEIVADGWMKGTVESTGQTGLLPSNYVEEI